MMKLIGVHYVKADKRSKDGKERLLQIRADENAVILILDGGKYRFDASQLDKAQATALRWARGALKPAEQTNV